MHLANHSDPRTAAGYVIPDMAMSMVPAGALPELNADTARAFGQALTESKKALVKTGVVSARHRGFEPLTYGSGDRTKHL
jgi:hypothetical protein